MGILVYMIDAQKYHDPAFDERRKRVHEFVQSETGLPILPIGNLALARVEDLVAMQKRWGETRTGGYSPKSNAALVGQVEHPLGPRTSRAISEGQTAHEIAHSISQNDREHYFFNEVVPGIVEHLYLGRLIHQGLWTPSSDIPMVRGESVAIIPGNMRYVDAIEGKDSKSVLASSGLVAIAGLYGVLQHAGIQPADLLAKSSLNGSEHFAAMKGALEDVEPGIVKKIEALPETHDGGVHAAALAQAALKRARGEH